MTFRALGAVVSSYMRPNFISGTTTTIYDHTLAYNQSGQVTTDTVTTRQGSDNFVTVTANSYGTVGTTGYALGAVVSSTGDTSKNGVDGDVTDTSTTNTYAWYDAPVVSYVAYKKDVGSSTTWTTSFTLTAAGAPAHASISDGRSREVDFILDAAGQAVRRNEVDGNTGKDDPHQIWYRCAGREMGMVTNDATLDTDYAGSVADRGVTPQFDAFHNGVNYGLHNASFGEKVMPYSSYDQGGSGGSYTAQGGETLSQVAAQSWGDASLWYLIADANGLGGDMTLIAGQHLNLPTGVTRTHINADTFKPYDPGEVMGNLSPTAPKMPKKPKCMMLKQIVQAIITVAVFIVTAPTVGVVGGAMLGDAAGQLFGMATGLQHGFNYKEVAITGIAALASAGIGEIMPENYAELR